MGSGVSSTQYAKRGPEPEGLTNLRNRLLDKVLPGLESYSANDWNNARTAANNALNQQSQLLTQLPGQLDSNRRLTDDIAAIARTGEIPSGVADNLNASVNQQLQSGLGSMLNGLSSRGVINSSIASQGINSLSQQAADAFNRNYLQAYNSVLGGLGTALQGQNSTLNNMASNIYALGRIPEQAYSGAGEQLNPAFNLWKAWQSSYDNREDYDTVVQQGK